MVGLLSAVCRTRTCSFEEVARVMLTEGALTDNKFLEEMGKYDLLEDFWKLCEQYFGYIDSETDSGKTVGDHVLLLIPDDIFTENFPRHGRVFSLIKAERSLRFWTV